MTDVSWIRPELLAPLIAGHVIGDFTLQSDGMVDGKKNFCLRALHVSIVMFTTFALLGYPLTWWWLVPAIFLTHFVLDSLKTRLESVLPAEVSGGWLKRNGKTALFLVDQIAHVLALLALVWLAASLKPLKFTVLGSGFWVNSFGPRYLKLLVLVTGFILATQATGCFLGTMLKRFEQEPEAGVPKGGYWIGALERALIFIFILAGEAAGIGFLAAAKSVFRFGELKDKKDRKLAEYILIGTLMSFTCAMIIGYVAKRAMGLIK